MAHKIEITVEQTYRISKEIEVSDDEYAAITKDGEEPRAVTDMLTGILDGDANDSEYDYAVWDSELQKTIVDWR